MVDVRRTNTILYTDRWPSMVAFYREALGLRVSFENDWFVEFEVAPGSFVSIADAGRSTIAAGAGRGITLSWEIGDVESVRASLAAAGVDVGQPGTRWGARVLDVFDPAGNRIEFWSTP